MTYAKCMKALIACNLARCSNEVAPTVHGRVLLDAHKSL